MNLLSKINTGVAYVLALIGSILVVLVLTSWDPQAGVDEYQRSTDLIGQAVSYTIYLTVAALILFVLGLMFFGWFIRPGRMIPLWGGMAALAAVFGIGWSMSSDGIPAGTAFADLTPTISHLSGAGLYVVYILAVLAVASILFSIVSKFFR